MEEQILDNLEEESTGFFKEYETLSDLEIFKQIWFSPRKVLGFIHQQNYDRYILLLLLLYSIVTVTTYLVAGTLSNFIAPILTIPAVLACIGLYAGFFELSAILIGFTGKLLDGKGSTRSLFRILVFGSIPTLLPIGPIIIYTIPTTFYINDLVETILAIIIYIPVIWMLINYVIGISIVQQFSTKRALLNYILSALVLVIIMILLGISTSLMF